MSKQKRDDTYDRPGQRRGKSSGDGERQRGHRPEPPRGPKHSGDFLRQWEKEETGTLEDEDLFGRDEAGDDEAGDDEAGDGEAGDGEAGDGEAGEEPSSIC